MRTTWPEGFVGTISTLGSHFPSNGHAFSIHSTFPSTINLKDETNLLYALVMHQRQLHPCSAVMRLSNVFSDFTMLGLAPGRKAMLQKNRLCFDCGLWVSFVGAKRVHPDKEAPPVVSLLSLARLQKRGELLSRVQYDKGTLLVYETLFQNHIQDSGFSGWFTPHARLLLSGVQTKDLQVSKKEMLSLLGLGPGSTPAGDDFLCGFLLSLSMLSLSYGDASFRAFVQAWLNQFVKILNSPIQRTTDISLQMLRSACEGLYPQALISFARTFSEDASDDVQYETSLQVLSEMGHSSGYDAASGLMFGLVGLFPMS